MDDKKIRKISKKELLEILLSQAKRIDELEQKLEKTESKLNSKRITIDNDMNPVSWTKETRFLYV